MQVRRHITFANVMSMIAVFAVLAGSAFAAVEFKKLKANSVGTKQIKNNAVNSSKVKDGSLLSGDFATGQLPAGPKGADGAPGAPGTAKAYATIENSTTPDFETGTQHPGFTAVARPAGVGTGVYCLTPATGVSVTSVSPIASPEWKSSNGLDLLVEPLRDVFECPVGTLEVRTYDFSGGVATITNDVAFTVLLP